jgi:DNA topoisomerase-3
MLHLVRHFGDQEDSGAACGLCDVCAPGGCIAQSFREPSTGERDAIERILAALRADDGQATGKLHRELFKDGSLDRRSFEHVLGGLVRAGLVLVEDASFQKDGERIDYQRVSLTDEGLSVEASRGARIGVARSVALASKTLKPKKRKKAAPAPAAPPRGTKPATDTKDADARRRAFFAKMARGRKKGRPR